MPVSRRAVRNSATRLRSARGWVKNGMKSERGDSSMASYPMSAAIRQTSPNGRPRSMYGSSAIFTSDDPPVVRVETILELRGAVGDEVHHPGPVKRPADGGHVPDPAQRPVDDVEDDPGVIRVEQRAVPNLDVDRRRVGGHARVERRVDLVRAPGSARDPRAVRDGDQRLAAEGAARGRPL